MQDAVGHVNKKYRAAPQCINIKHCPVLVSGTQARALNQVRCRSISIFRWWLERGSDTKRTHVSNIDMQCAAVITCRLVMRVPPQKCWPAAPLGPSKPSAVRWRSDATYGNRSRAAAPVLMTSSEACYHKTSECNSGEGGE